MTMELPPARTIDDFLDQVYQEYKRKLPPPSSGCNSIWHYRHYIPLPLLALCIANSSDATEILMLSYLLANPTFRKDMFAVSDNLEDADDDTISMEGAEYLAASIFFGMLIGGTILGFLSDHIGRRPALLAGLVINATAGLFSSFPFLTPNIEQLTFWRFIAGIGIGATVPSLFSLASEWSPKEVRGAAVTLVATFWMVGSLFVSGLAWTLFRNSDLVVEQDGIQDVNTFPMWRVFAAMCALPSALGAWLVYSHVPESPRFLASEMQKYSDSAKVCNQIAESLDIQLASDATHTTKSTNIQPFIEEELREDYHASTISTDPSVGSYQTRLLQSLLKLYSPQLLTKTTLPLQLLWFSLSFATYGITTWINTLFTSIHLQNIYFNSFLFALANLPGNLLSIIYADRWGRKRMLVWSLIAAALGLACFAILVYYDSQSKSLIVLSACIFQMFSIVSWNAIDILTGEMFPTCVRSAGMGICTAFGRFGGIFSQFVNAHLMAGAGNGGKASSSVLIVACGTLLIGAAMPMLLEKDNTQKELKDDIPDETVNKRSITLGCMGKGKDHMSDDEIDNNFKLRNRGSSEDNEDTGYQSLRQETFLL